LPPVPLVRAKALEHLPELLAHMNVRFETLLRQVGLPEVPLDREDSFLPLREALAVLEEAAHVTGMEHFGLLLATTGGFGALGSYGTYIQKAPNLLEAIRRAGQFIGWHTLGARLSLTRERRAVVWRYELSRSVRADRRHAYLFALVLMRNVVRLAKGPGWMPDELRMEQAVPAGSRRHLREAFGEHIACAADENALVFPESLLALPLLSPADHRMSASSAAGALAAATPRAEFVASLRLLIRSFLSAGHPSAALLARVSGLSLRSFQRHLAVAGISFSDLVDQVRCEVAFELMRNPDARLIDIGLELGYSDAANFTRAFRRWTGFSPHLYRRLDGTTHALTRR
jgi:AraC-like DNA-binding protein